MTEPQTAAEDLNCQRGVTNTTRRSTFCKCNEAGFKHMLNHLKKEGGTKKKGYLPNICPAVVFYHHLLLVQLQGHLVALLDICEK